MLYFHGTETEGAGYKPCRAREIIAGAIPISKLNACLAFMHVARAITVVALIRFAAPSCWADEGPFLTTITHQMEEAGNLEVATRGVTTKIGGGSRFLGVATEFEYGVTPWWTTEVNLGGQSTGGEKAKFIGYEWENRFQVLPHEHWINPILGVEFESIRGSDEALLDELVGHDGKYDPAAPNPGIRREDGRQIEAELILGSSFKSWEIAENVTTEKDLGHVPFAFGYAVGISRSIALEARHRLLALHSRIIQLGVELYGGLGTHDDFGLRRTSQYLAPVAAWTIANGVTLRVSPAFGLTHASDPVVLRFGASYEVEGFGRTVRNLWRGPALARRSP